MATHAKKPRAAPDPSPADKQGAFALLETFRADPPGLLADDRYAQVRHFVGLQYIAINAVMDAHYGSTVQILKRQRRDQNRTTFGPGVTKALPGSHQQANDEKYVPLDDDDHPLCKWVVSPNEHQSFADVLSYLVMQLLLTGEQYLWAVPNEGGKPVEGYALPSAFTTPHLQPGQSLEYPHGAYRVSPSSAGGWGYAMGRLASTAILPAEEVKRHRKPHPYLMHSGYSPLSAGSLTLDVLDSIDRSRWSAMEHGPQLDTVLLLAGMTDKDQLKNISEQMAKSHAGARNARKFMALGLPPGQSPQGALQNVGANARELDYTGSWTQVAEMVLALFGVPKDVAGLEEAGSYSKLYANLRQFYHRQSNSAKQQSEFFSRVVAEPWSSFPGEYKIQIDLPKPEDPDLMERQIATDSQSSAITVNEIRALRGREPVEGGDVPPQVYTQVEMQKAAPQPPPGVEGQPGAEGEPAPGAGVGQQGAEQGDDEHGTQGATVQAALAALGVPGEGEAQQKAIAPTKPGGTARVKRNEGDRWQTGGKWYTKRNGQTVQTAAPGTARPTGAKPTPAAPSRHHPAFDAIAPELRDMATAVANDPKSQAGNLTPEVIAKMGAKDPSLIDHWHAMLPREQQVGAGQGAPTAKQPGHSGKPPAGAEPGWSGKPQAKPIPTVPAHHPVMKQTLSNVSQWAATHAAKHADKIAAHFGIPREQAHKLLVHAITHTANHALKSGGKGASGTMDVGGKKLRVTVLGKRGGPTAGAPPRPTNPAAEGAGVPTAPKQGLLGRAKELAGDFASGYRRGFDHTKKFLGNKKERQQARQRIAKRGKDAAKAASGTGAPRVGKAMSSLEGSAGGFLVSDDAPATRPRKRKKRVQKLVRAVMKALETGE